jgi:hypothetical protein
MMSGVASALTTAVLWISDGGLWRRHAVTKPQGGGIGLSGFQK